MIAEIGLFALIIALVLSTVQGIIPLWGAQSGRLSFMLLARPLAYANFFALTISILSLAWCFYAKDFSVLYVANNSNSLLPLAFRLSAVWGGHEGSLLLWLFMLGLWGAAVAFFSKTLDEPMVARVLAVIGLVAIGLTLFTIATSNPFTRLLPPAEEGRDLNPLLQDPGLIFHPPLLYMGYVGLSVAFAFAIAALISGKLDSAWARWSRPWALIAWVFLSLGIILGSWWAYYELGWGGWWFWDPVENASLMPWLIATALIHSLAVTEKRGSFKIWTVLLAISAFSLSLVGTFLVRSGVLTSVHAFATDPTRGRFILILLAIVIGSSLLLFAVRAHKVSLGGSFAVISRESAILIGNVVLVVSCLVVLLGTIYPLIIDALLGDKISVGPPYFNTVFVPIFFIILFFTAITPFIYWKKMAISPLLKKLIIPAIVAIICAITIPLLMGQMSISIFFGVFLALFIATSVVVQSYERCRLGFPPNNFIGMQVAHFGVAVCVFGVTMVSGYSQDREVKMFSGNEVTIDEYSFILNGVNEIAGANYNALRGDFTLRKNGKDVTKLYPEKRSYFSSAMPMTEAGIYTKITKDAYISMGEPLGEGAWAVQVFIRPFMVWVWGGVIIFSIGGLIAISSKRYRLNIRLKNNISSTNFVVKK